MTQWRDVTALVDKKAGKLPQGMLTDTNEAQIANIMGPPQRYPASDRDVAERTTERNKKRRTREAARSQDESSSSLPPAKKARTVNLFGKEAAVEATPPALDTTDIHPFVPEDYAEVERYLSSSLMKSIFATYEVTSMNIISSSKIQSKVTAIIEKLGSFSFVAATKPNICLLRAKGAVASKLITIVEITKREISKAGGKWYQYNVLNQILAPHQKTSTTMKGTGFTLGPKTSADMDAMEVDDNEEDQAMVDDESSFETMKTALERAIEGKPKVQAVPIILIFLSRVRNDSLRGAFGEQTNALT